MVYQQIISVGIIITIINYSSAFSNYLFHLISGRILTVDSFGQLQSLINLNTIISVLIGAIGPSIILLFNDIKDQNIKYYLSKFEKKISLISSITLITLLILYPPLKFLLKLQPIIYFIWIFQVISSIFNLFYLSILQSKLKLIVFALSGFLFSISKNILSILFATTPLREYGPYLSPALATVISALLLRVVITKIWPSDKKSSTKLSPSFSIWKYSLSTLLTNTFLILIISLDVFIVRYYFSETISGIYSSTSIIGKIIFYTVSPLTVYLFPVFIKYRRNVRKLKLFFHVSTLAISLIVLLASIVFKFFPDTIINLLLGSRFIESAKILPAHALFISVYSIIFHLCQYFLSQESPLAYKIPISIFLTQSTALLLFHQNLSQIITVSTLSITIGIALVFALSLLRQLYQRLLGWTVSRGPFQNH